MSSIIGRSAFRATAVLRNSRKEDAAVLRKGAKRDPELLPLYAIVTGVFAWAGYRFVQSPTGSDYSGVGKVPGSEPWKEGSDHGGKFQYYIDGNPKKGIRDHPSALNTTIIPNVTLPKELHEKYNKYGKSGWDV